MNAGIRLQPRRGAVLRRLGWVAASALLAVSVFAPAASAATPPSEACMAADASFEYSVDGGAFKDVSINDGPSAFPQHTVTVRVKEGAQLPADCARSFGLVAYNAGGGSWPGSVYEHFIKDDTATIGIDKLSATLTVTPPGPGCFGQTDFYTDAFVNGTFFPGTTHYSGALEPHYPDVPTPYGKISGANGGDHVCGEATPTPVVTPSPTPTPVVTPTPDVTPTPTPTGSEIPSESTRPTPAPSGGVHGATGTPHVTPPSTDTFVDASGSTGGGWRIVLAGLALLIIVALTFTQPARSRRRR
jgi:cell division septation protein DedD